jgi:hypothetical protein
VNSLRDEAERAILASQKREYENSLVFNRGEYFHLRNQYQTNYISQVKSQSTARTIIRNLRRASSDPAIERLGNAFPPVGVATASIRVVDRQLNADSENQKELDPDEESAINIMSRTRAFYHSESSNRLKVFLDIISSCWKAILRGSGTNYAVRPLTRPTA